MHRGVGSIVSILLLFAFQLGCDAERTELLPEGNAELGIAAFRITETSDRAEVEGLDAAGTVVASLSLRVGHVELPEEQLAGAGREFTVRVRGLEGTHASVGMFPLTLPVTDERAIDVFLRDPHVAGVLAERGIAMGAATAPTVPSEIDFAHNGSCTGFVPPCMGTPVTSCCLQHAVDASNDRHQKVVCGNQPTASRAVRLCEGPGATTACGTAGSGGCAVCVAFTVQYNKVAETWWTMYAPAADTCSFADSKVGARAYATSNTSLAGGTDTKLTLGTESYDLNNEFASSRFTAKFSDYYFVTGTVSMDLPAAGRVLVSLVKNGNASNAVAREGDTPDGGDDAVVTVSDVVFLNVGDTLELWAKHDGTTATVLGGSANTSLTAWRMSSSTRAARAYATTTQSVPQAVTTKLTLAAESYDLANELANSRYTVTTSGYYFISGQIGLSSVPSSSWWLYVVKNGNTGNPMAYDGDIPAANAETFASRSDVRYLEAGDYIELWVRINGTGGATVMSGAMNTRLTIWQLPASLGTGARRYQATPTPQRYFDDDRETPMVLQEESYDLGGHATTSQFTASVAGHYLISGSIASGGDLHWYAFLRKNGVTVLRDSDAPSTNAPSATTVTDILPLSAGDTIDLWGVQINALDPIPITESELTVWRMR